MPEADSSKNGDWGEYRRLLISELERLDKDIRQLAEESERGDKATADSCATQVDSLRRELESLRMKLAQVDVATSRVDQLERCSALLKEQVSTLRELVAALVVKSGVWGAIGGLLPVVVGLVVWLLTKGG